MGDWIAGIMIPPEEEVDMPTIPKDKGIAEGRRDEKGVRILNFADKKNLRRGVDYQPTTGSELTELYKMARENTENMQKARRTKGGVRYDTVDDLENGIIAYWEYLSKANQNEIALIPDVEGLCAFLGISRRTLFEWERDDVRGFAATISQVKNDIAACKKQIGMQGHIPPIIMAMDFNNNHGYVQKQEVVLTPNNPLGDAASNEELIAKYQQYADLDDGALPEATE